jgi:hypothetical protein
MSIHGEEKSLQVQPQNINGKHRDIIMIHNNFVSCLFSFNFEFCELFKNKKIKNFQNYDEITLKENI